MALPQFAANLGFLFQEVPFLERFARAAAAGFSAVELAFEQYAHPREQIGEALVSNGLQCALINAPAGDWAAGDRGLASVPGRQSEFMQSVTEAVAYATALKCRKVHVLSGVVASPRAMEEHTATLIENLKQAAPLAAQHNVDLLLEPISTIPDYYLTHYDQVRHVIDAVGLPNVRYQCDIFHVQNTHGNICRTLDIMKPYLGHVQVAGVPGRHEPDAENEINFTFFFRYLVETIGYKGYVGAEYNPRTTTEAGLGWLLPSISTML